MCYSALFEQILVAGVIIDMTSIHKGLGSDLFVIAYDIPCDLSHIQIVYPGFRTRIVCIDYICLRYTILV